MYDPKPTKKVGSGSEKKSFRIHTTVAKFDIFCQEKRMFQSGINMLCVRKKERKKERKIVYFLNTALKHTCNIGEQ